MFKATIACVTSLLAPVICYGFDPPTVSTSQLISMGPPNKPVNETAVASARINGVPYLLAMWQVQDVPGSGVIESPVKLRYAVGTVNENTGAITWDEIGDVPQPSSHRTLDPTVTAVRKKDVGIGFCGGGAALNNSTDAPSAFIVLTGLGDTEFDAFDNDHHFSECLVRYTKLGEYVSFGSSTGASTVHLLAQAVDPQETCAERAQIMLRRSINYGNDWGNWIPLEDEFGPIKGFPSAPVFRSGLLTDEVFFAYMDIGASFIRAATAVDGGAPAFFDLDLDVSPVLPVAQNETYFEAAEPLIAGDFQIGPFVSIAMSHDGDYLYVVYHDLAEEPEEGEGDFDIFLLVGERDGNSYVWEQPVRVNQDSAHHQSDQFMPVITVSSNERIHIAWYDTRHDHQDDGENVEISLYYAYSDDNGLTFDEVLLAEVAIETQKLLNKKFLGDSIAITMTPNEASAVVVYMGTLTLENQDPEGIYSMGSWWDPELWQSNEAILEIRVHQ